MTEETRSAPARIDKALLEAISNITVPPGDLRLGTGTYEKWALLALKGYIARAGFTLSETAAIRNAALDEAVEECLRGLDQNYFSDGFKTGCRNCADIIRALKDKP